MSLPPDDMFIGRHNMEIESEVPKRKEPNMKVGEIYDSIDVPDINNDLPIISLFFILLIGVLFFIVNII